MKSLQELMNRLEEEHTKPEFSLTFCYTDLLQFVPFEKAKSWFSHDLTKEEFEEYYRPLNRGNVIGCMEQYMKLAWEKCLDRRKYSAIDTIAHYHAWLWILEDNKAIEFLLTPDNFACFGAPILKHICDKYKWELESILEECQLLHAFKFISGMGC